MTRNAQYLADIAKQVEDGLISMREAMDLLAGNERLTADQQRLVDQAVMDVRMGASDKRLQAEDGGEAYAYHHPGGGVAWGFNSPVTGFCIARGIRD